MMLRGMRNASHTLLLLLLLMWLLVCVALVAVLDCALMLEPAECATEDKTHIQLGEELIRSGQCACLDRGTSFGCTQARVCCWMFCLRCCSYSMWLADHISIMAVPGLWQQDVALLRSD